METQSETQPRGAPPRGKRRARHGAGEGPRVTNFTPETFADAVQNVATTLGTVEPRALYAWHRRERDLLGYDRARARVVECGCHLMAKWRRACSADGVTTFLDYAANHVWSARFGPVPDAIAYAELRRILPKPHGSAQSRGA